MKLGIEKYSIPSESVSVAGIMVAMAEESRWEGAPISELEEYKKASRGLSSLVKGGVVL